MNIQSIFKRLLADLSVKTGVFLDSPDDLDSQWLLNVAPALNREMLLWIENEGHKVLPCEPSTVLSLAPQFPEWLLPLWERFILTDDALYLRAMIQILVFCYKIEYEPTQEQQQAAYAAYYSNEGELKTWRAAFGRTSRPLLDFARNIVSQVTYKADWSRINPKHGPGAVFPPCAPYARTYFTTDYKNITAKYPICDYFAPLPNSWETVVKECSGFMDIESDDIVARLEMVPKDSRGPRTICVHPKEAIWIQQGLRAELESCIKRSVHGSFINFQDQSINQDLARLGSMNRHMATIDLKDASDRLHKDLVRYLFGDYVYDILSCCRATHVKINDTSCIALEKWAPMGNCLMFPVESLVFYALVRAGICVKHGRLEAYRADVYVYGDDIIIPSKFYDAAICALSSCGFIPNDKKSYYRGFYRESCGVEAYHGQDVTPIRLKNIDIESAAGCQSLCALALRLRTSGFDILSSYIYSEIRKKWELPISNNPASQGIFEYRDVELSHLLIGDGFVRFNPNYHRFEVAIRSTKAKIDRRPKCDWNHIVDSINRLTAEGSTFMKAEYPVPYQERLTYGWQELLHK